MQADKDQHCITLKDVKEASQRLKGMVKRTPLLKAPSSMNVEDKEFYFKVEAMQHTGSFKFRGALNATKSQIEQKKTPGPLAVVTHSSGNHAQAVALAARLCNTKENPVKPATIVMPRGAPQVKQEATKSYGGEVILCDNTNEARQETADLIMAERGATFIHPSENPLVIAGQGTIALEIIDQLQEFGLDAPDAIIIPVGGGGLASGNAVALRGLFSDKIKIILAEPEVLDDTKRSFESGQHVKHRPGNKLDSVADGLKTTLGPNTWPIVRDLVDDVIIVSEEDILRATKHTWEQLKVCIEPSAGVGVAVAIGKEFNSKYSTNQGIKNVAVILCGGNVDILETAKKMEQMGL
mmetsp:Transcript_27598/g.40755  ORF Transcript_27598/g.40755 Transcript_27598/m.40755 type:complete len:352 (-) Transcript_27598:326-1381(-)